MHYNKTAILKNFSLFILVTSGLLFFYRFANNQVITLTSILFYALHRQQLTYNQKIFTPMVI